MQKVLAGLNHDDEPPFLSVYLDDILVYSETFEDHLDHLQQVISRMQNTGLQLKSTKCYFILQPVEYLGNVITLQGISPNPARLEAVQDYPTLLLLCESS